MGGGALVFVLDDVGGLAVEHEADYAAGMQRVAEAIFGRDPEREGDASKLAAVVTGHGELWPPWLSVDAAA
jgi:hypothetical protein